MTAGPDDGTAGSMAGSMGGGRLEVHALVGGYRPELPILHGVSLEARPGEVTTIIGPNGAGKSTLIKAVAGFVGITSGEVRLEGREVTGMAPHEMVGCGLAFVPQRDNVFVSLTIQENLRIGGFALRGDISRRIEEAYGAFPVLAERRNSKAAVLSGGERQMLAIARALMPEPRAVMLDEPTAGLAPRVVHEVLDRVRMLADTGVTILMVEQNAKAALARSDRAYVLAEGCNHAEGDAKGILEDPDVRAAFLGGEAGTP